MAGLLGSPNCGITSWLPASKGMRTRCARGFDEYCTCMGRPAHFSVPPSQHNELTFTQRRQIPSDWLEAYSPATTIQGNQATAVLFVSGIFARGPSPR